MISSNILDVFRPKSDEYTLPHSEDSQYDCIPCLTLSGLVMGFFGVTLSLDITLAIDKKSGGLKVAPMMSGNFGPKMRYAIRGIGIFALVGAVSRGFEIYRVMNEHKKVQRR